MEYENGNKLIAEFMGYELKQRKDLANYIAGGGSWYLVGENFTCMERDWRPEEDWNQLMPVVEKIEKDFATEFELIIYSSSCYIKKWNHSKSKYDNFISGVGTKIEAVYDAVVQFITWYNTIQNHK